MRPVRGGSLDGHLPRSLLGQLTGFQRMPMKTSLPNDPST